MCYNARVANSSLGITHLLDTLRTALPPAAADKLEAARRIAHDSGLSLYLVGGSVRDLLLGRGTRDLDLVTAGDAPSMAAAVAEQLGGRLIAHRQFGTATVELDALRLDFSTARRETYPRPGALPQVVPSNMDDDLGRRDFSINAMALCLAGAGEGSLLDPRRGQGDLDHGLVRVLHSASFIDDPTRMFRAVRYEQRLGFNIERETLRLFQKALDQNALNTLSGDRIRRELESILEEERPASALLRADALGLLRAVHPGLSASAVVAIESSGPHSPLVYLAALAHPLSSQQAAAFASRLNMPREWVYVVRDAAALHLDAYQLDAQDIKPSQVVAMLNARHGSALDAARSICAGSQAAHSIERYLSEWRHATPSLKGGDLPALGVSPGPETGRMLKELGRARLDGQVSCREEEIALVESLLVHGIMEGASGTE